MAKANLNSMSDGIEAADLSEFCVQVDDTYHALRAFNFLMEHTYEHGGGISGTIAYGTSHLLRRQVDDLEEIRNSAFTLVTRLKKAEAQPSETRHGLPDSMVILPAYRPGMEHELRAKAAAKDANSGESLDQLRNADLGQIAKDTNLAEATVRRVVERLLAEPQAGQEPDRKAV